jgi:hypothetical protein
MTRKILALVGLFALLGLSACGGGTVVKDDKPEVLLPGELVESSVADITLVRCQGRGNDQRVAIVQARKGCLEWYINYHLAQSAEERNAYLAKQRDVMANLDRYVKDPAPGAKAGLGEGVKSQVRVDDETVKVEIITQVHRRQLEMDLVGMGIMKSKEEMLADIGRPTLMVVPFPTSKGNKHRGMIEGTFNSYLTTNKWEVVSSSAVQDLEKMTDAIGEVAGAEDDEAAKIAMAAGADIYIKFDVQKAANDREVAWGVKLEAAETTTGRMIASHTKISPARSQWEATGEAKAIQDASSDAMGIVLAQITDYWREDAPKGSKFYIAFKNAPKNLDVAMNSVLKKTCTQVKLERSTAKEVVFRAQCKADNLELAGAIDEGITAKAGGAAYDFAAKNKNSIIVVFQ